MSDTQKHIKPNVPNLRFPGFEGEWEKVTIGQICNIVGGGTPDTNTKEYWNGGIQWFTPSEVGKEKYVSDSNRTISVEGLKSSSAKLLPPYSILLSSRATVGECSINLKECCTNQGFQSAVPNMDITATEFLYYRLLTHKREFIKKACGSTFLEISAKQISKLNTFIPARAEQEKIADLLSMIDQRIAIQNKVIKDYKCIKESILNRMMNEKDESCRIVTLGEITEIISRRNKEKVDYPMYSVTNEKGFVPQEEQFEDREMVGEDISAYRIVHKEEIAYNPARINVGSIAQYTGNSPCMISSLYVCIKAKKGIDSNWLIQVLRSEQLVKKYNLFAEGGVRLYLFYPNFSRIKIPLPSLKKQLRISEMIEKLEKKIALEQSILSRYQNTKAALLRDLFV